MPWLTGIRAVGEDFPPTARGCSHLEANVADTPHVKLRDARAAADVDHLRAGAPDARAGSTPSAVGRNAQYTVRFDGPRDGQVDPTKVVRTALQDVASVAGLLVTTEAMGAEKPEKEAPAMPGGGGMGRMGDMHD